MVSCAGLYRHDQGPPALDEEPAQRFHLVSVNLDAGPERSLEDVRVRRSDAVPLQRVQEGRKLLWGVEPLAGEVLPPFFLQNSPVKLVIPEHLERLTLRVVVGAGELNEQGFTCALGLDDVLDQPPSWSGPEQALRFWVRGPAAISQAARSPREDLFGRSNDTRLSLISCDGKRIAVRLVRRLRSV